MQLLTPSSVNNGIGSTLRVGHDKSGQECACAALQAAGGVSHDGQGSILDLKLNDTAGRTIIALGSKTQVEQCLEAMRGG